MTVIKILTQDVFFGCVHRYLLHVMNFEVIKIDVKFYKVFPIKRNCILILKSMVDINY